MCTLSVQKQFLQLPQLLIVHFANGNNSKWACLVKYVGKYSGTTLLRLNTKQRFIYFFIFLRGVVLDWEFISSFSLCNCHETNSFNTKSTKEVGDCWGEWDGGYGLKALWESEEKVVEEMAFQMWMVEA